MLTFFAKIPRGKTPKYGKTDTQTNYFMYHSTPAPAAGVTLGLKGEA